ncbi:MAG: Uma2 family endonuclease [Acidobacteriota bacterium]
MAASPQFATRLEYYLQTDFRPDCDYVDGEILERNVGEREHSFLQLKIAMLISQHEREWGVAVYPEHRVQVARDSFRIPDVAVIAAQHPFEKIITRPPLLCIEIMSSEDRWARITERFEDYRRMGVPNLWAVDPIEAKAWAWSKDKPEWTESTVLEAAGTPIRVDLAPVFAELAQRKAQQ